MTEVRVEFADPRRFTLEEAKREIARQECLNHGHDFDVVVTNQLTIAPQSVLCRRCGASWSVVK